VRLQFDPADHPGILLAVSEACTNAIVHAYPDGEGEVDIGAQLDGSRLHLSVRDFGVGPDAPISSHGQGYGMLLMRAHAASFEIRDCEPGTEVSMTFELTAGPEPEATGLRR
jgi:serine/threonine-protein kinase RsbW